MTEHDEQFTPDDEQPVVRPTQSVRDFRWRQRGTTAERHAQAAYLKTNRGLLERQWAKQWARTSPDEQASVLAQHQTAVNALFEITTIISGLTDGRQPGIDLFFPDVAYVDYSAIPRSNTFPDVNVAARMDVEDFDALDDEGFRTYGKITKVPGVIWSEFCRLTLAWARTTGDCEAAVQTELEQIVKSNAPQPAPATQCGSLAGLRQPTSAEERGTQAHQRDIERTRRLMAEAKQATEDTDVLHR